MRLIGVRGLAGGHRLLPCLLRLLEELVGLGGALRVDRGQRHHQHQGDEQDAGAWAPAYPHFARAVSHTTSCDVRITYRRRSPSGPSKTMWVRVSGPTVVWVRPDSK